MRAKHERKAGADLTLFDALRQSPVKSQFLLPVKRQSARPKRSKQKARDQVKARTAQVELRYHPMTIDPTFLSYPVAKAVNPRFGLGWEASIRSTM